MARRARCPEFSRRRLGQIFNQVINVTEASIGVQALLFEFRNESWQILSEEFFGAVRLAELGVKGRDTLQQGYGGRFLPRPSRQVFA